MKRMVHNAVCDHIAGEYGVVRFPKDDNMSLVGARPRYDLGESLGPELSLNDLLADCELDGFGDIALGYGTAAGDPALRAAIAARHGADAEDVVVTVGGMH